MSTINISEMLQRGQNDLPSVYYPEVLRIVRFYLFSDGDLQVYEKALEIRS